MAVHTCQISDLSDCVVVVSFDSGVDHGVFAHPDTSRRVGGPDQSMFDHRRQTADLDYLTGSHAAMASLAEQYVGLPGEVSFESAGLRA
jgi:hypothetical protein